MRRRWVSPLPLTVTTSSWPTWVSQAASLNSWKVIVPVGLVPPESVAVSWIVPPAVALVALVAISGVALTTSSVNVQTVSRPDSISRLLTPVEVEVPVGAGVADWISQEAEVSVQPAGTTSVRSSVSVARYGINCTEPLPLIVQLLSPFVEAAEALNWNAVPSSGSATLTIVRNPLSGVITHSSGFEVGEADS